MSNGPDLSYDPNPLQRLVQRAAALGPASRILSGTLHRVDRPILRLSGGRWTATSLLSGLPVIMLTTTGARSGQPRSVPLIAIPDGDTLILIASSFGRTRHPAWYHNLKATPRVMVSTRGWSATYIAHEAAGQERERLWPLAVQRYAGYAAYARRTAHRQIPVMVLVPAPQLTGDSLP